MDPKLKAWLAEQGYDVEALQKPERATELKHLTLAFKAETTPPKEEKPKIESSTFDEKVRAFEAESQRITHIQESTERAMQAHVGNPEKIKQLHELCQSAIADQKMGARDFDLALMRVDRMLPSMVLTPRGSAKEVSEQVLEAAICQMHRLPNLEKQYSDQVLQTAHTRFRRGLGLKELTRLAAERNSGYRGDSYDLEAMCRAAFVRNGHQYPGPRSDVGPSTISVPGILSNVANKFLAAGFLYGEQSWRQIAKIKTATDFKEMTTYRLDGRAKFRKIAPGGEITHGSLSELSYTNRVDTYGIMLGIDRRDFINDDLGAFIGVTSEMARGAYDSLCEVFWGEYLDDATFFPTDKSLGNYDDGAVDSVLSLAGLENADAIFAAQTKPDGTPLGVQPRILLVPRGLRARAQTLVAVNSKVTGQGADAAAIPDDNPWAGMFDVVNSIYLGYSSLGGSTTAWYLLADPMDVAAIEIAFLFGKDTPTVETGEFEFDRLGLAMRGYMDFGCKKQEYRAGVKMKGAV